MIEEQEDLFRFLFFDNLNANCLPLQFSYELLILFGELHFT